MTASPLSNLLQELKDRNIDVVLDSAGRLKASAPDGQMTAGILAQLKEYKEQIIDRLRSDTEHGRDLRIDRPAGSSPAAPDPTMTPPESRGFSGSDPAGSADAGKIGVNDDFFALGGNSLLAMQMIAKVNTAFKVDLPFKDAFEYTTVKALAGRIAECETAETAILQPADTANGVPVTSTQRGFWQVGHLEGSAALVNIVRPLRIEGDLQIPALKAAFAEITRRHDSLRAYFAREGRKLIMRVEREVPLAWSEVDISDLEAQRREQKVRELIRTEIETKFSLEEPPLMRLLLIALSDRRFVLVLSIHHIISDEWSINVIKRELSLLYDALVKGVAPVLEPRSIHFPDYVYWQNERQRSETFERQLGYWFDKFRSMRADKAFPVDYEEMRSEQKRRIFSSVSMKYIELRFPDEHVRILRALSERNGWTMYVTFMAIVHLSLRKYSGIDQQVVISPTVGRFTRELWDSIGLYVNLVLIVSNIDSTKSLKEFVDATRTLVHESYDNSLAFGAATERALGMRLLSAPPLAAQFNYIDFADETEWSLPGLEVERMDTGRDIVPSWNIGLNVVIQSNDASSFGMLGFNKDLFAEESALRIRDGVQALVTSLAMQPDAPIRDV